LSDSETGADSGVTTGEEEDSEDEFEAHMRSLETKWTSGQAADDANRARMAQAAGAIRREMAGLSTMSSLTAEDFRETVFVAIPDDDGNPLSARMVVEQLRWGPMFLCLEQDNGPGGGGRPMVLRFSDVYDGVPQPFTGWAVPLARVSGVRPICDKDYPLQPLQGMEQVEQPRGTGSYDIDKFALRHMPADPHYFGALPNDFQEMTEICVAPRDEPPFRILMRPMPDLPEGYGLRIADTLSHVVTTAQREEWLKAPATTERADQLERQAQDIVDRARLDEEESKRHRLKERDMDSANAGSIDKYIDLLFRRYEFILWDPVTLMGRLLWRDHPMTGIFVPNTRMLALERILLFSCALVGAIMTAALFFENGMGNVAVNTGPNATTDNATNGSETSATGEDNFMIEITTTTTTPVPEPDQIQKMIRQIWVSAISIVMGTIPAVIVGFLFKRKVHFETVEVQEKRRLLQSWRWKRKIGYGIALVYLLLCYFFLWQFAMNQPMDIQKDFTASSAINLVWKMLLKPIIVFAIISLFISAMRSTTLFDNVMFLVPLFILDFSMFTAEDVDDMLYHEELIGEFFDGGGLDVLTLG